LAITELKLFLPKYLPIKWMKQIFFDPIPEFSEIGPNGNYF